MTTKLTLSPEAWAALRLLLSVSGVALYDNRGARVIDICTARGTFDHDAKIAAFIAALVNAALTPADPGAAEPVTGRTVLGSGSAGRAAAGRSS